MSKKLKYTLLKLKSSLRNKILGKYAIGVIYETKNGNIAAPVNDLMVGKKLGKKGEYDMSEVNTIKDFIKPTDTIYIVGGHWGTLLIPLSKYCKKVIGYEANPKTFYFLETNLLINRIDNVSLFNNAAGDASKKVKFYTSTINTGGSKIKPKIDKYMYKYDNPDTIEVDMIAIDDHAKANNLDDAQGIIMDIEGAEYYALQGMTNTLKASKFLYIEYVPHHLENVSTTSNEDFFSLILPHYNTARFMNEKSKSFDINNNREEFFSYVNKLKEAGKSDNILFSE
ncbi:FkbM family methyltransferase [Flavivirga rizhaonensis]|uniref:FkbM family methyltransferase n=1 Tax=Flavivirga rizhaonensis TaxID=2559571 RepID=A0A4S1DYE4_9FLAO|nr:FkbM family methyltransferase [Flavivirga rizhaonensis]TGV02993.1 FkbM family methyltransferase [Flavivirga rizhaonensis]